MSSEQDPDPNEDAEIERITARIRLVELAKTLAAKGSFAEALKVLHRVRDQYQDAKLVRRVDWLIAETERQQGTERTQPVE